MSRYFILDNDNRPVPVDALTWAEWWAELVSTVFIGIDHRFRGGGPPLLFETMVFGGPLDQSQWRYVSHDDATTGHAAAVRMARVAQGQKIT